MRTLLALVLLAASAGAQIVATDYLPLSRWASWFFEQVDDPDDTRTVRVLRTNLEDGARQYNVSVPDVGELDQVRVGIQVQPDGTVELFGMRIIDDTLNNDFDADITMGVFYFTPALELGDDSTAVGVPVVHPVNTSFKTRVKVGPFSKTVTVFVTGTITVEWIPVLGAQDTLLPGGEASIPAVDLVRLVLTPDLTFSGEVQGEDFEETLDEGHTLDMLLARDIGFVFIEDTVTSAERQLKKAILAGRVLGEGFEPNRDITSLALPTGETFSLHERLDPSHQASVPESGPQLLLSDLDMEHLPNGRLIVTGAATTADADPGAPLGEVFMKGVLKPHKSGDLFRMVLKGRALNVPGLLKPVGFKGVADITADDTLFELFYASRKDAIGTVTLGIDPLQPEDGLAHLELDGLVDTAFEFKKVRGLGSEGTLHFANTATPVLVVEKRVTFPVKEGFDPRPDKRVYVVSYEGLRGKPLKIIAESTDDPAGHTMLKLLYKHYGTVIKTATPEDPGSGIEKTVDDVIE